MSFIYIQSTTLFGNILGYNNPGSPGQLFSFQIRSNSNISPANVTFMLHTNATHFGASANLNFNQWYHLCGIYDQVNTKMYLNGVFTNQTSHTGSFATSSANLFIGSDAVSYTHLTLPTKRIV